MRNILLVFVMVTLPVSIAVADPLAPRKPARTATPGSALSESALSKSATPDKPLPTKRNDASACAAYGPNFVKVNGSDTCVKVGGDMSVGVSGGR
jgi:hypothetical protein